jgi:hypothetical protein
MLVFPLAFKGEPWPSGNMAAIAAAYRAYAFMMYLVFEKKEGMKVDDRTHQEITPSSYTYLSLPRKRTAWSPSDAIGCFLAPTIHQNSKHIATSKPPCSALLPINAVSFSCTFFSGFSNITAFCQSHYPDATLGPYVLAIMVSKSGLVRWRCLGQWPVSCVLAAFCESYRRHFELLPRAVSSIV